MTELESLRSTVNKLQSGADVPTGVVVARAVGDAEVTEAWDEFVGSLADLLARIDDPAEIGEDHYRLLSHRALEFGLGAFAAELLRVGSIAFPRESKAEGLAWQRIDLLVSSEDEDLKRVGEIEAAEVLGRKPRGKVWRFDADELKSGMRAFLRLADLYFAEGRHDEALALSEAARKVAPSNAMVLRNLGRSLGELGRLDEAVDALTEALWADNYADFEAVWLGTTYARMDQLDLALECFLLGAIRDPDDSSNFIRAVVTLLTLDSRSSVPPGRWSDLMNPETVLRMLRDANACGLKDADFEATFRAVLGQTVRRLELNSDALASVGDPVSVPERIADAMRWHKAVESEITAKPSSPEAA